MLLIQMLKKKKVSSEAQHVDIVMQFAFKL
jgi:hypothetical protein